MSLVLFSCNEDETVTDDKGNVLAVIEDGSVENEEITKVQATAWETGDEIGVYCVKKGQALKSSGNYADNRKYVYSVQGKFLPDVNEGIYLKNPEDYDFYTYYPYNSEIASPLNLSFSINKDQSDDINHKLSDLVTGRSSRTDTSGKVVMDFTHALSMIELEWNDNAEIQDVAKVIANLCTKVTVNLMEAPAAQVQTITDSKADITMNAKGNNVFTVFAAPSTIVPGNGLFTPYDSEGNAITSALQLGGEQNITMLSGNKYNISGTMYNVRTSIDTKGYYGEFVSGFSGGTFFKNRECTIKAKMTAGAPSGTSFIGFFENDARISEPTWSPVATEGAYTFNVDANRDIVAKFGIVSYGEWKVTYTTGNATGITVMDNNNINAVQSGGKFDLSAVADRDVIFDNKRIVVEHTDNVAFRLKDGAHITLANNRISISTNNTGTELVSDIVPVIGNVSVSGNNLVVKQDKGQIIYKINKVTLDWNNDNDRQYIWNSTDKSLKTPSIKSSDIKVSYNNGVDWQDYSGTANVSVKSVSVKSGAFTVEGKAFRPVDMNKTNADISGTAEVTASVTFDGKEYIGNTQVGLLQKVGVPEYSIEQVVLNHGQPLYWLATQGGSSVAKSVSNAITSFIVNATYNNGNKYDVTSSSTASVSGINSISTSHFTNSGLNVYPTSTNGTSGIQTANASLKINVVVGGKTITGNYELPLVHSLGTPEYRIQSVTVSSLSWSSTDLSAKAPTVSSLNVQVSYDGGSVWSDYSSATAGISSVSVKSGAFTASGSTVKPNGKNTLTGNITGTATAVVSVSIGGKTLTKNADFSLEQMSGKLTSETITTINSVNLSVSGSPIVATGGSATLKMTGTFTNVKKYYVDGVEYKSETLANSSQDVTSGSSFSGSATGFSISGSTVTAAANTGAERSIRVTGSYKGLSSSVDVYQNEACVTTWDDPSECTFDETSTDKNTNETFIGLIWDNNKYTPKSQYINSIKQTGNNSCNGALTNTTEWTITSVSCDNSHFTVSKEDNETIKVTPTDKNTTQSNIDAWVSVTITANGKSAVFKFKVRQMRQWIVS